MQPALCQAIAQRRAIELRYHRYARIVEPYVYGAGRDGVERIRCYQIAGDSDSGEMTGWKLLRVDEIVSLRLTDSLARRYRMDAYSPARTPSSRPTPTIAYSGSASMMYASCG